MVCFEGVVPIELCLCFFVLMIDQYKDEDCYIKHQYHQYGIFLYVKSVLFMGEIDGRFFNFATCKAVLFIFIFYFCRRVLNIQSIIIIIKLKQW